MERRSAVPRRAAGSLLALLLAVLTGCGGADDERSPGSDRSAPGAASGAPGGGASAPSTGSPSGTTGGSEPASPSGTVRPPSATASAGDGSGPRGSVTGVPEEESSTRAVPSGEVEGVPGWWPRLLALPPEARVLSVERDRCELSWLAPVVDLEALAGAAVAQAERGGATVEERSGTTQNAPTASPGSGVPGDPVQVVLLRHSVLTVRGAGVAAVLSLDEMEGGGVLGRYRLTSGSC